MLPFPGAPSSSWAMWKARLKATFDGANLRVCTAFWLFGLINNVLYVIILSAALDLVGPDVPKGVVLLADVIPSFLTKLCAPYFIHLIPYPIRVILFSALSASGMLLIALTPAYTDGGTITTKLAGVILASLSSGGGELSFLGLTHFYGPFSLAAWGSGTGGAGLAGAGLYSLATTTLGLSVQKSLVASSFLPIIMLLSFFVILPRAPLQTKKVVLKSKQQDPTRRTGSYEASVVEEDPLLGHQEEDGLLDSPRPDNATPAANYTTKWYTTFLHNLRRARRLFFPYMLPLLLVYVAEYTINLGLYPVLLFPLPSTPFKHYRAFYPTYSFLYQAGVFVSRSSTPFLRIHHLYPPSFLQIANFFLLASQAVLGWMPDGVGFWIVMGLVLWEGLLGGAVYVNTFAEITDRVAKEEREFSLGATSVSDSGGICIAGFLAMAVEKSICAWQVRKGRDWCRQI